VEGLERVEEVDPGWPQPGAAARWRSGPAGRGKVTERILRQEPLELVESEIEDDEVVARQLARFTAAGELSQPRTRLTIDFAYRIKRRSPLTALVDLLFVRGAMQRSLRGTLARFARTVES
jgi:hypothetical protein